MLKTIKIPTIALTCFSSRRNHHQGAILCLAETTIMNLLCSLLITWSIDAQCKHEDSLYLFNIHCSFISLLYKIYITVCVYFSQLINVYSILYFNLFEVVFANL